MFKDGERAVKVRKIKRCIYAILKTLGVCFIISIFVMIFIRSGFMKTPKQFAEFAWTDNARAAYEELGSLEVGLQDPYSEYDEDGLFHVSDVAFAKEAGEIQLTARYNSRSTVETLMTAYGLTERPEGEVFVYILRDDKGNEYTKYTVAADAKPTAEFRRVIFDGVDFTDIDELYLSVYYGEDVTTDAPMNVEFVVYESDRYIEPTFPKPEELDFTLYANPAYINNLDEE